MPFTIYKLHLICFEASKMAQQVNELAAKTENLSLIPETQEQSPTGWLLTSTYALWHECVHTPRYTHTK